MLLFLQTFVVCWALFRRSRRSATTSTLTTFGYSFGVFFFLLLLLPSPSSCFFFFFLFFSSPSLLLLFLLPPSSFFLLPSSSFSLFIDEVEKSLFSTPTYKKFQGMLSRSLDHSLSEAVNDETLNVSFSSSSSIIECLPPSRPPLDLLSTSSRPPLHVVLAHDGANVHVPLHFSNIFFFSFLLFFSSFLLSFSSRILDEMI